MESDSVKKLKANFLRAINSPSDDINISAIDGFSIIIRNEPGLATTATKMIAGKVQSSNTREALNALCVLEECMGKCGSEFQSEINKFRFLNELIRLVSIKYDGNTTPKIIRDKILNILLTWTVQYPQETKIKEAYDMLRTQGVVHEPVQNIRVESSSGNSRQLKINKNSDDKSAMLRKLLHSKNPVDVQAANLLIQNIVRENDRCIEMKSRRISELQKVQENINLLNEMLDQYDNNVTSADELGLMEELHLSCETLQPTIQRLAEETPENEGILSDILEAKENLSEIFIKYKNIIDFNDDVHFEQPQSQQQQSSTANTGAKSKVYNKSQRDTTNKSNNTDLLTSVFKIDDNILDKNNVIINNENKSTISNDMHELNDIFIKQQQQQQQQQPAFDKIDTDDNILMPQPIQPIITQSQNKINDILLLSDNFRNQQNNGYHDIQTYQTKIPQMSSPLRQKQFSSSSSSSSTTTIPNSKALSIDIDNIVSDMLKITTIPKNDTDLEVNNREEESDIDVKLLTANELLVCDEPKLNNDNVNLLNNINNSNSINSNNIKKDDLIMRPLAEIDINLEKIRPGNEPPRVVMEELNGLKVILNFAKDHPRPDVSVIVISTINQGTQKVTNFQFDASVSKPCKLRILQPSDSTLPGVKPFRPPVDDITQVLLLSNPTNKSVNMICIISYCLDDDPDPIKECIEIRDLPVIMDD